VRQGTIVITPPTDLPISLAEAKAQLRIDASDDFQDVQVSALIAAASAAVEGMLGWPVMRQTRETVAKDWPGTEGLWLGRGDNLQIGSVKYIDPAGAEQTLAGTVFIFDAVSVPARLHLATGESWPALRGVEPGAVKARWTAGWADAATVPGDIKHAIRLLIGHWFENREGVVVGVTSAEVQFGVEMLLAPHRPPVI
jgi:uncharacterized phiE125 gp8 family phage protein